MRGIVREIRPAEDSVVVEHEDVPGYMPSMTMPFNIRDAAVFSQIHPGEAISFELVTTADHSWIRGIGEIDGSKRNLPKPKSAAAPTAGVRLHEGDAVLALQLINHENRQIDNSNFAGGDLVLTFIFTRCPVPDFCPRISSLFSELEKTITSDPTLKSRMRLLSIFIDPEHDTPAVLRDYAENCCPADPGWSCSSSPAATASCRTRTRSRTRHRSPPGS